MPGKRLFGTLIFICYEKGVSPALYKIPGPAPGLSAYMVKNISDLTDVYACVMGNVFF